MTATMTANALKATFATSRYPKATFGALSVLKATFRYGRVSVR